MKNYLQKEFSCFSLSLSLPFGDIFFPANATNLLIKTKQKRSKSELFLKIQEHFSCFHIDFPFSILPCSLSLSFPSYTNKIPLPHPNDDVRTRLIPPSKNVTEKMWMKKKRKNIFAVFPGSPQKLPRKRENLCALRKVNGGDFENTWNCHFAPSSHLKC